MFCEYYLDKYLLKFSKFFDVQKPNALLFIISR